MFLTEEDYRVVCDDVELDVLTQSDTAIRQKAERVAMEEIASYIRPRYDTDKAFTAEGDARNSLLVQITVDIALYHMALWLPEGMSLDRRQVIYDQDIEWLIRVGNGLTMPDLPTYTGEDGTTDASNPIRFGGMPPTETGY